MIGALLGAPRRGGEEGSVVAELALSLPAVVLTVLLGVGALGAGATQVALQDAASDAARLVSRGESADRVNAVVAAAAHGASPAIDRPDGLVCVTVSADARAGPFTVPLSGRACALDGGW